jgi:hypothetical protein
MGYKLGLQEDFTGQDASVFIRHKTHTNRGTGPTPHDQVHSGQIFID